MLSEEATLPLGYASIALMRIPLWLEMMALAWIAICVASALFILIQTLRKPQKDVDYGRSLANKQPVHGSVRLRGLPLGQGLIAAVWADTISIALFEVGMFAWMTIVHFWVFPSPHLNPAMAVFWFMMQLAMIAGFFTTLPANAWLIRKGWKEKIPPVDPDQVPLTSKAAPPSDRERRVA